MTREREEKEDRTARAAFRPGYGGACEAQIWKFSQPQHPYDDKKEPESELITVESLDQALHYMRYWTRDFQHSQGRIAWHIALVSGSPLD
jgi:hypothetical protein